MSRANADRLHAVLPWSYGFRSRVRRYATDRRAHPELAPWYPRERLFDPIASLDMCTPFERAWSARYAATTYSAEGAIVELGTWLGGITLSLVRALPDNPAWAASPQPVHVFDEFLHDRQRERLERSPLEHDYVERGSFLHHFERRVAAHRDQIALHVGDVTGARWTGGPIELLFNDVCKSWRIWNAVRATFYPSLVPGVSTVVEQDFAHALTPWLHLWHYRARDHLRFVEHIPDSGSVVFRLERALPPALLAPEAFDDYDEAEVEAAYRWASSLVDGYLRGNLEGGQVMANVLHGDLDRAAALLTRILATATPEVANHSELLSEVAPALVDELDARNADAGDARSEEPSDEPVPVEGRGPDDGPPDEGPSVPPAERTPCDLRSVQRDLEAWSGRPIVIATAIDGRLARIDAAPAWSAWLEPDAWIGSTLERLDAALDDRLPDGRCVGSVARDDSAAEVVILLGTATRGRRMRMVIVPSATDQRAQTILIASPDLDPPDLP